MGRLKPCCQTRRLAIAHISRQSTGLEIDKITDPYLSELQQFAREQGFEQRLRLIYSD